MSKPDGLVPAATLLGRRDFKGEPKPEFTQCYQALISDPKEEQFAIVGTPSLQSQRQLTGIESQRLKFTSKVSHG